MRRIRYQVACSLDGYIAGPNGENDWIIMDPDIDFTALFAEYDTLLMGRRTFDGMQGGFPGMKTIVASRTLQQKDHPTVTIVNEDLEARVRALRDEPGKDIWLFGGGGLFRSLLDLNLVDTVEPAIIPVLLGAGIPFMSGAGRTQQLKLTDHRMYPKSGIALLKYDVANPPRP